VKAYKLLGILVLFCLLLNPIIDGKSTLIIKMQKKN